MQQEEFIKINKNGWNELIRSGEMFANTSLPEYGPFLERTEKELNLFDKIKGANVLEIGCAEGDSLKYLLEKGANDIWGIDISEEQIKKARAKIPKFDSHFIISPMEEKAPIPNDYFDYIFSIFSIGYCSNLDETLKNIYHYLKQNGTLIISWTHPLYFCLDYIDGKVIMSKSYFDETSQIITKGPNKVELAQKNLKISTIINTLVKNGFYVEELIEEKTVDRDNLNGYKSSFWRPEKAENCPTTTIYRCRKLNK